MCIRACIQKWLGERVEERQRVTVREEPVPPLRPEQVSGSWGSFFDRLLPGTIKGYRTQMGGPDSLV